MEERSNQEVEAKFRILNGSKTDRLAHLATISPGFTAGRPSTKHSLDVYYDTDSYSLLRAGVALRVRRTESAYILTAEAVLDTIDTAVLQRIELECDIDPTRSDAPYLDQTPVDLQALINERLPAGKALTPILALLQKRTKRIVFDGDANPKGNVRPIELAELSLDDVWVLEDAGSDASPAAMDATKAKAHFRELELELLPGSDYERLRTLSRTLSEQEGLESIKDSKLETGLNALGIILA